MNAAVGFLVDTAIMAIAYAAAFLLRFDFHAPGWGWARVWTSFITVWSVQLNIRNALTKLMKNLDYGKGYTYAHDTDEKIARMSCLPESLQGRRYYMPAGLGREANMKARLAAVRDWREGRTDVPPFSTPAYGVK